MAVRDIFHHFGDHESSHFPNQQKLLEYANCVAEP
uniref:Uncharacterized protein n=1 Tax=Anguilla anguilla TaxID=7936 RepID=A0A0E9RKW0_ANGAN